MKIYNKPKSELINVIERDVGGGYRLFLAVLVSLAVSLFYLILIDHGVLSVGEWADSIVGYDDILWPLLYWGSGSLVIAICLCIVYLIFKPRSYTTVLIVVGIGSSYQFLFSPMNDGEFWAYLAYGVFFNGGLIAIVLIFAVRSFNKKIQAGSP